MAGLGALIGCGPATDTKPNQATSMLISGDEVVMLVRGWQRSELDKILADFEAKYGLDAKALLATENADRVLKVSLGRPLPADRVLYLVNYIHYPEGFDMTGRSRVVVAAIKLSEAFAVPQSLIGQTANIYVPANDDQYDEVYATVGSGAAFRVSFTNLAWEPVVDRRQSPAVAALLARAN
jgi:hypothetical protein